MFDLLGRLIELTEHQGLTDHRACCRSVTLAASPASVAAPIEFGDRQRAASVYLNVRRPIPENRAAEAGDGGPGALPQRNRLSRRGKRQWLHTGRNRDTSAERPALPSDSCRGPQHLQRPAPSHIRTLRVLSDEVFRTWRAPPRPETDLGLPNCALPNSTREHIRRTLFRLRAAASPSLCLHERPLPVTTDVRLMTMMGAREACWRARSCADGRQCPESRENKGCADRSGETPTRGANDWHGACASRSRPRLRWRNADKAAGD